MSIWRAAARISGVPPLVPVSLCVYVYGREMNALGGDDLYLARALLGIRELW